VEKLAALAKDPLSGLAGLLASQLAMSSGTPQFWGRQRSRLQALIRQKGVAPSAFATFSAADLYWSDLLRLLGMRQGETWTMAQRQRAIALDPGVCVTYFRERLHALFTELYGDDLVDFYIRYEFQERGSVHAHCLIWLRNVPDLPSFITTATLPAVVEAAAAAALPVAAAQVPATDAAAAAAVPPAAGAGPADEALPPLLPVPPAGGGGAGVAKAPPLPTYCHGGVRSDPLQRRGTPCGACSCHCVDGQGAPREPHATAAPTPPEMGAVLSIADYFLLTHRYVEQLTPAQRDLYEEQLRDKMRHPAASEWAETMGTPDAALAKLAALHELVQRHTMCGPGCLRKGKCRHLDRASADFSEHPDTVAFPVPTTTGRAAYNVGTARNDDRFGRVHLQTSALWLANTDFQLSECAREEGATVVL
jgi:hypothetical protein